MTAKVDRPIVESAKTSVLLRTGRSPKWPKSAEPIGRAMKAMAKMASDASRCGGVGGRKEQLWEDDDRGGGVDVEVEELDGGADETGKEHLQRRVPPPSYVGCSSIVGVVRRCLQYSHY
jgi:hypothetical protein